MFRGFKSFLSVRRVVGIAAAVLSPIAFSGIHGSGARSIDESGTNGIHGSGARATDDSSALGIHGSGARGIHGSGARTIEESSVLGIHGSGARSTNDSTAVGIHGSGARDSGLDSSLYGIHGSGARGIHGSGAREISGASAQGIHGSGARGIHGSGARGIHGSGARAGNGDAISMVSDAGDDAVAVGSAFELAALGPIESITTNIDGSATVVVFGQTFLADAGSVQLAVGDYVFAASITDGSLDILVPAGGAYLAGVSEVGVVGAIAAVSPDVGQFSIGSTTFDFSNLLSTSPEFSPKVGDYMEVSGNQPTLGGPVILGIHGSGARGIHGSGARGIHGSGARGIHGSGAR